MTVTLTNMTNRSVANDIPFTGSTKIFEVTADHDLSGTDTTFSVKTAGGRFMSYQLIFANYTSVTAKWQRSLDGGTTYDDIAGATTSTSGDVVDFEPKAPLCRLSVVATLSASTDTLSVWAYME